MTTYTVISGLITALLGSLGFALIFKLRPIHCASAAFGGLLVWGTYLLAFSLSSNVFISALTASAIGALYSEIFAKIEKAPATILLIPSVVPLVPGSALYYTMSSIVGGNAAEAFAYGKTTIEFALSISLGIAAVLTVWSLLFQRKGQAKN